MKKLLFLFVVLSFSLFAQNYFPLHIGNSYQYIVDGYEINSHFPPYYYKEIKNFTITRDTIVNNIQYYFILNHFMRYDSTNKKIFMLCNSQDTFVLDFNDTTNFNAYNCLYNFRSTILQCDVNILGQNLHAIGLECFDGNVVDHYYWVPGFGIHSNYHHYSYSTMGYGESKQTLVEAEIYENSNFVHSRYNYKPEFKAIYDSLDGNILKFSSNITHPLSDTTLYSPFNYIDRAILTGYYQNGSAVIPIDTVILTNTRNLTYNAVIPLDTALMNHGYSFYYKVIAKDKGLVPAYASYPNSGYLRKTSIQGNYFPLHIGNSYQFITQSGSAGGPIGVNINKYIEAYTITKDTIVNNKQYFYFNKSFFRYDSLSQKAYMLINGNDILGIDFNDTTNSSMVRNFFGSPLQLIGSRGSNSSTFWAPDLGIVNMNTYYSDPHMGVSDSHADLVEAFIYGNNKFNHYTYNYKPAFTIKDNKIISGNLLFSFYVNHPLTDTTLIQFGQNTIFNYVDTVYFVSFYKKGNEVIPKDTMKFSSDKLLYSINRELDPVLMNNGYSFNYKAVAKDKGIVPVYTSFPDTGYFTKVALSEYYCPLSLGNSYQYITKYSSGGRDGGHTEVNLKNEIISKDTTVNNKQYYYLDLFQEKQYVRYDTLQNKLYKLSGSNENMSFDFYGNDSFHSDSIIFGQPVSIVKRYYQGPTTWAGSIGKVGYYHHESYGAMGSSDYWENLTEALVYNNGEWVHFTNGYKPAISVIKNQMQNDSLAVLVSVSHPYDDTSHSFSYISGVYLTGYYKKDNQMSPYDTVYFSNNSKSVYSLNLLPDISKLNNGYTFQYKITVKDKGLFPAYTSYPDTGYISVGFSGSAVSEFSISQNYPNPFNPSTHLRYNIPYPSNVNITIYNALGSKIKELVNENKNIGNYEIVFDGAGLASGVYFVTIKASSIDGKKSFIQTKKMILMK